MTTATLPETAHEALVRDGFAEIAEAQQYLRLSRATIYQMMEVGTLVYARFGRRRRIPWRTLHAYAAGQLVGGASQNATAPGTTQGRPVDG